MHTMRVLDSANLRPNGLVARIAPVYLGRKECARPRSEYPSSRELKRFNAAK